MKDLHQKHNHLEAGEVILDVRTPEEYKAGHIPGSLNVSHEQVAEFAEQLKKYSRIYIHCKAGGRAGKAASALFQLGFKNLVCISSAGMDEWIASGFPVEK
jgi:rhodanese-related sulfurtransferase